ncbi:MAG: tyrosine-type recombinase/integrase, partial [Armatimonadota bacterium]
MKTNPLRYIVTMADAERILTDYVERQDVRYSGSRTVYRGTLRHFLDNVGEEAERAAGQLILDEPRIIQWMIRESDGRSVKYMHQRFAVLGHYLRALFQAKVIAVDLLGELRARYGIRSWGAIAHAVRSDNPTVALAALKPPVPLPGPLEGHIMPFIELERTMGKRYKHQLRILQDLDQFLGREGASNPQSVSGPLLQQWMEAMTCSTGVRINKIRFVSRFFEHLRSRCVVIRNPVDASFICRMPLTAFRPFIFTTEQMALILAESYRLPRSHRFPLRSQTCHAMLAVLYGLGLRHGEARHLRIRDVDFQRDALFIDQTKFNKSRYVPFGPKMGQCLREYLNTRREVHPLPDDTSPFFVAWGRTAMGMGALLRAFHILLKTIGIPEFARPRLHDLRHTFAVHRLLRWYREGVNVQQRLPWLSTFMGHVDIQSTQVYLTITADLLNEA